MKRAALVPPRERQKVQLVSCPCCEARLALHFVHGENEVYDVELLGSGAGSQQVVGDLSRVEAAGNGTDYAAPAHQTRDEQDSATEAMMEASTPVASTTTAPVNDEETGELLQETSRPEQVREDLQTSREASGSSKLFPLFYRPKKTVHLVRHGHTASLISLEDAQDRFDLRLTSLGHQQARSIAPKMALLKPEVILVSPLTRALQTLSGAFPSAQEPGQHKIEVTPLHAEHVMCSGDVGRPPQVLAGEYPWLSFDALPEVWWYSQPKCSNDALRMEFNSVEPMEELRKRVGVFRQFLRSRPENVIVVIGHSTFFRHPSIPLMCCLANAYRSSPAPDSVC
ncbi:hypothetical protein M758_9G187400 [Ceratodon purpureus]|nr:hypothetical protein M758_9G187400 [Ceratodon purpureus]